MNPRRCGRWIPLLTIRHAIAWVVQKADAALLYGSGLCSVFIRFRIRNLRSQRRINDSTGRSGLYSNGSTTRGTLVVWMTSTGHLPLGAQAFESLTSHSFLLPFPPPSQVLDCRA